MVIIIDIGNTRVKAAVFEGLRLVEQGSPEALRAKYPDARVFTSEDVHDAAISLSSRSEARVEGSPLIINKYRTPETLGADRLAAAVEAHAMFPEEDILVVDFGTAITIDMVSKQGEFLGGNISPGLRMRLKALYEHTEKLPLCEITDNTPEMGTSTHEAIEAGVVHGIAYEIEGYAARHAGAKIIFTGGDGDFFAKHIKNATFVGYDLVLRGLNRILNFQ